MEQLAAQTVRPLSFPLVRAMLTRTVHRGALAPVYGSADSAVCDAGAPGRIGWTPRSGLPRRGGGSEVVERRRSARRDSWIPRWMDGREVAPPGESRLPAGIMPSFTPALAPVSVRLWDAGGRPAGADRRDVSSVLHRRGLLCSAGHRAVRQHDLSALSIPASRARRAGRRTCKKRESRGRSTTRGRSC